MLIMFKNGVKYERYVGPRSKTAIVNYIEDFIDNDSNVRDETWLLFLKYKLSNKNNFI